MKYLIFSDLHGSSASAEIIAKKFNEFSCDKMICLGDVLYHGPRNDLPDNYNPKLVISILNQYQDKIICLKGNCDAEVDQMVLLFPLSNQLDINLNGVACHLEHGHHLDELKSQAKVIFYGHTHVAVITKNNGQLFINPGSITIPKNNTKRSYLILDEKVLTLYDIDDNILSQTSIEA